MNETLKKIMEEQKSNLVIDKSIIGKDKKCPFTGNLKLRGKIFTGIVVSKDTHRSVVLEWTTKHFVKKYERFMIKKTRKTAHNPDVISANIGDKVIIAECKPLSKTKNFVVIKNLGHSVDYMVKKSVIAEDSESKKSKKEQVSDKSVTKSEE
jgi:small subunit ribosomal protein S17